ncbi:hypothetical protein [Kistimonas asteriae]|uniref:hypothetical protein n=1 Tax=Kistimonas asteriae TaxID=517724 RepID=UPI001BA97A83|nr:hypothetical protein [Kistimonas asteriae]
MSAKSNVALLLGMVLSTQVGAEALKDTGTVDALVRQGQIEFQKEQAKIKQAAQDRLGNPAAEQPRRPVFGDTNLYHPDMENIKPWVDRLNFVGYLNAGDRKEAQVFYKGSAQYYRAGDKLPKSFQLVEITESFIRVRHLGSKATQTLYLRSIASVLQEKKDYQISQQAGQVRAY